MNVSVAMTVLNGMPYLKEQLSSVLCRLQPGDEAVISDDGSADGSVEFLRDAASRDSRVRLLAGPGRGVTENVANALSACRGDIIFLCDQDDRWYPEKRDAVVGAFAPQTVLVLHDARVVDAHGNEIAPSFLRTRGFATGFWRNLWKNGYIGCCMAFRRELLPQVLPFPPKIPMHDQWIGMQAQRCGKVTVIEKPLMDYRRHADNLTGQSHLPFGQMLRCRWGMVCALASRPPKHRWGT